MAAEVLDILMRLAAAGFLGACIGFERRVHHKAIGNRRDGADRNPSRIRMSRTSAAIGRLRKHNVYAAGSALCRC
jgi:hypothetical protein